MNLNELKLEYGSKVGGERVALTLCPGTVEAMSKIVPRDYYGAFLEHAARLLVMEVGRDQDGVDGFRAWLREVVNG